jgi:hypothetical protein
MNLLVNALKLGIRELAQRKGIEHPRVLHKTNAKGEMVIALILPSTDVPPMRPVDGGGEQKG